MVDVLGRELEGARRTLEAAGYRVEIVETRTPRQVTLSGPLRVVRQHAAGDGLIRLTVTPERYVPPLRPARG